MPHAAGTGLFGPLGRSQRIAALRALNIIVWVNHFRPTNTSVRHRVLSFWVFLLQLVIALLCGNRATKSGGGTNGRMLPAGTVRIDSNSLVFPTTPRASPPFTWHTSEHALEQ
jgi:hypothetical protein